MTIFCFISCVQESENKTKEISKAEKSFYNGIGVGPIKELKLDSVVNRERASEGEKIFLSKCISCHTMTDERKIGPGLKNVTKRRRPEWILNQILNPLEMTQKDSLSKILLSIYLAQMTPMNLTEKEARDVLEYFRSSEEK
jgi:mono/diheme cytochrome c family protein